MLGVMGGISAAASIGGGIVSGINSSEENNANQKALNLQLEQTKAKSYQDTLLRNQKITQIQSTGLAMQGASGMTLSSGSFNNLQAANYQKFAEDSKFSNENLQFDENEIYEKEAASERQFHNQIFSDAFNTIGKVANLYSAPDYDKVI